MIYTKLKFPNEEEAFKNFKRICATGTFCRLVCYTNVKLIIEIPVRLWATVRRSR
jgi:hypothetical protein